MPKLQTDELNNQEFDAVEYIKNYFKPMEISEERKEEREDAAKDFRDVLLFLFALISAYNGYDMTDWDYIESQFRIEFERVSLIYARNSIMLQGYISEKTGVFLTTTREHLADGAYWTSDERATKEAVNDSNAIVSFEEYEQALESGATHKRWKAQKDMLVRDSHKKVDGVTISINELFSLKRGMLRYAGDEYYCEAESINCRCCTEFLDKSGNVIGIKWTKRGAKVAKALEKVKHTNIDSYDIMKQIYNLEQFVGVPLKRGDDVTVRKWYYANVHNIPNLIDNSLPLIDRAKQAFNLRNKYKHEARKAMENRKKAAELDELRPAPEFEDLIESKMKRKGLTREGAIADILKTASKTNKTVNGWFGL